MVSNKFIKEKRERLYKELALIDSNANKLNLKEALDRIYRVALHKKGHTYGGRIIVPQIMIGKEVRLILEEEKGK